MWKFITYPLIERDFIENSTSRGTNSLVSYHAMIPICVNISKQIIHQWMFCSVQKPYLLILANLQEINSTIFPSTFRLHASLSTWNFPFLKKKKSRKLFTFLSFLNQSSCITSYNVYRFICPLRARIAWQVGGKIETKLAGKKRNF